MPGPLLAVLCYHDLAWPGENGSWLKLDVERFEKQLVVLKKFSTFIRPDALFDPRQLVRGRLNLLLTFDDGLLNSYRLGLPVLQRHGVPALFFISTWHMESGEPFWFDRLIRPLQSSGFGELDLRHVGLGHYQFPLAGGERRWPEIQRLLEDVKRLDERQDGQLVRSILTEMRRFAPFVEELHEDDRPLNREEVLAMRNSGLCWFGSHAHNHRRLTKLEDRVLREELEQSRFLLQRLLGEPVEHIAYPNGDADVRVQEACLQAGYRFGYTVSPGRVERVTDPLRIPRILVGGFDTHWKLLMNLAHWLLARPHQAM